MMVMAADIMLSASPEQNRPLNGWVVTPPDKSLTPYLIDLAQKIVRLDDNLFIGWTGDLKAARKFIAYARSLVKPMRRLEIGKQMRFLAAALKQFYESQRFDMRYLLIGLHNFEAGFVGFPESVVDVGTHQPALVMGQGIPDFQDFVQQHGGIKTGDKNTAMRYVQFLFSFLSKAVCDQRIDGFGFDRQWGLGMELVVNKTPEQLVKVDRVLYQSCFLETFGTKRFLRQRGDLVFNYYDHDDLVIITQPEDGTPRRPTIVRPPDRLLGTRDAVANRIRRLRPPPSSPKLICTTIVPTGSQAKFRLPIVDINEMGNLPIKIAKNVNGTVSIANHDQYIVDRMDQIMGLRSANM
jgi:hypothetical protein